MLLRVVIKSTHEAPLLLSFAVQTYMSIHLHAECRLKDSINAPASAACLSQTPECLHLKVQMLLFVSISLHVLSFKDTRSACFLKCSSAWDTKMGTDEIRQKIKWHGAIWSPPEHWKLGWGFGVRGSAAYLSDLRINVFTWLFLSGCYLHALFSSRKFGSIGECLRPHREEGLRQRPLKLPECLVSASRHLHPSHLIPVYAQVFQLILSELYIFIHEGRS